MLIERVYVNLRKAELRYKVVSVDLYSLSVVLAESGAINHAKELLG